MMPTRFLPVNRTRDILGMVVVKLLCWSCWNGEIKRDFVVEKTRREVAKICVVETRRRYMTEMKYLSLHLPNEFFSGFIHSVAS
jgi:hypothetical protein